MEPAPADQSEPPATPPRRRRLRASFSTWAVAAQSPLRDNAIDGTAVLATQPLPSIHRQLLRAVSSRECETAAAKSALFLRAKISGG